MQLLKVKPHPRCQVISPGCLRPGEQNWRKSRSVSSSKVCWSPNSGTNMAKAKTICKLISIMRCKDFWIPTGLPKPIWRRSMKRSSSRSTLGRRKRPFLPRGGAMRMPRAEFLRDPKLLLLAKDRMMRNPRLVLRQVELPEKVGHRASMPCHRLRKHPIFNLLLLLLLSPEKNQTPTLKKKTNGPQSKSSTPCCTSKSKSKRKLEKQSGDGWWNLNLILKKRRRKRSDLHRLKRIGSMT